MTLLQGGTAGRLGGVAHSGAGRCHQEASPRKTNRRGWKSFPSVFNKDLIIVNLGHSALSDFQWPDFLFLG